MSDSPFTARDYPVAETQPHRVKGKRGRTLDELTIEAAVDGSIDMTDLGITPEALMRQAQIARAVGRAALANNFERASEMNRLPQDEIMRIYELLRPGRAASIDDLLRTAHGLRNEFEAPCLASFVEEAAILYKQRGLFRRRF